MMCLLRKSSKEENIAKRWIKFFSELKSVENYDGAVEIRRYNSSASDFYGIISFVVLIITV